MLITKNQKRMAQEALLQPNKAFDNLYRYVSDQFWLHTAALAVLENQGANTPGVDGVTAEQVNPLTLSRQLHEELKQRIYTPDDVRRVYIPKANGKMRPLGIPTIRDRVVQEALRMVIEPIMESKFLNCSTGFRPMRRTMDAIHLTTRFTNNNVKMWWVVEGDIKGCFDNIPHSKLAGVLKQHIRCKKTLALIESFLGAGISEEGSVTHLNKGVPQGGICSPLLANIYLHEMDKFWWERYGSLSESQKTQRRQKGLGNVQYIRYADDFIILTNGTKEFAQSLEEEFAEFLSNSLGLELSEDKAKVTHLSDGFDFLGFHLKRVESKQSNKNITLVTPSETSIKKFKSKIREMTSRDKTGDDPVNKIRSLNSLITGWSNYYRHVNSSDTFSKMSRYSHIRLYRWLKYKHSNVSSQGSIGKYVIGKYLGRHPNTGYARFHVHGTWERVAYETKLRRYRINWPKTGNPYLEESDISLSYQEEVPIQEGIWTGTSPQRQWAVAKQERLEIVGNKCEKCGQNGELDAHHVIPRKDGGNNSVGNLIILCNSCHKKEHKG